MLRKALTHYKSVEESQARKKAIIICMKLKNSINTMLTNEYGHRKNKIFTHYISNDKNVPIWGIFEAITLGTFGNLIFCLNYDIREEISNTLGIERKYDTDRLAVQKMIYAIKELRNATAHNSPIFDVRFSDAKPTKVIKIIIKDEFGIGNVRFNYITDYMILIVLLFLRSVMKLRSV